MADSAAGAKVSLASMRIMPGFAVLDPVLTLGLPAGLTASTGVDALAHALESYASVWNNPVSEGMALHAVSLVGQHPRTATSDSANVVARAGMLAASCATCWSRRCKHEPQVVEPDRRLTLWPPAVTSPSSRS
ncbi:MAG: iron-containing alcohol dehydrogenase [Chloroflexi bacterium]|nr:iron-containing alcohol dehydrogenase [Chloroflexota bacterium]